MQLKPFRQLTHLIRSTMLKSILVVLFCLIGAICALPSNPILRKLDPGLRYQYVQDPNGQAQLVDLWMSLKDLTEAARYDPDTDNRYHLFTRQNPSVSQPLLQNSTSLLNLTNFDHNRRSFILIHGRSGSAVSESNTVLVPAILAVEDANIIVVDWSSGASSTNYRTLVLNTIASGAAVGRFINWLNEATGSTPLQYHIIGHGFGGHMAGIVGRNVNGDIAYITGLNPALLGWVSHAQRFSPNDGLYTEVIHTNHLVTYIEDLAQVDFYPNSGVEMPGCDSSACDDARSYFYFAESIATGGFTGRRCINYAAAVASYCNLLLPGRLNMGGLVPKTGSSGVYFVETNAAPPFSQD